jgi:hypothetical protein
MLSVRCGPLALSAARRRDRRRAVRGETGAVSRHNAARRRPPKMTMVRLRRYSWFFAYVCAIVSGVMVAIIPRSGAAATYSERTLYSFCSQANCTDGGGLANSGFSGPLSGLIMDPAGNLYGTNPNGGANNAGVAFELSPRPSGGWTYTMLHAFCSQTGCADGRVPLAGLIMDGAGNLYGTTFYGGAEPLSCPDQGTVSSCPRLRSRVGPGPRASCTPLRAAVMALLRRPV